MSQGSGADGPNGRRSASGDHRRGGGHGLMAPGQNRGGGNERGARACSEAHRERVEGVGEARRGRERPELSTAAAAGLGEGVDADGDSSLLGPIPPAGRGKGGWRSFLATRRSSGAAVTGAASGGRTRLGLGFSAALRYRETEGGRGKEEK